MASHVVRPLCVLVVNVLVAAALPWNGPAASAQTALPALFYWKATAQHSEADLRREARRRHLVFHAKAHQARILKQENPGLTVVAYKLPGGTYVGEEDFAYIDGQEAWWIRDARGSRLQEEPKRSGVWLLDMSHTRFREFVKRRVVEEVSSASFDGVFLDVSGPNWVPRKQWYDQQGRPSEVPAWYEAAWPDLILSFHRELHPMLGGKLHIFNSWPLGPGTYREFQRHYEATLEVVDGVQIDGFGYNRTRPWPERMWRFQIQEARRLAALGKTVLLKCWARHDASALDEQLRTFCYTSYLLAADGRRVYYWDLDGWRDDLFTLALGAPLGEPVRLETGIYRREFANAVVFVNPGEDPARLTVGQSLLSASGTALSSTLLRPQSGVILLRRR